jgi:hypothetical protein
MNSPFHSVDLTTWLYTVTRTSAHGGATCNWNPCKLQKSYGLQAQSIRMPGKRRPPLK